VFTLVNSGAVVFTTGQATSVCRKWRQFLELQCHCTSQTPHASAGAASCQWVWALYGEFCGVFVLFCFSLKWELLFARAEIIKAVSIGPLCQNIITLPKDIVLA
jgi:hypothetical protein